MNNIAREAFELKLKINELKTKHDRLISILRLASQEDSVSIYGSFKFTVSMRMGAIDYDSIPELKKVNLDSYRKDGVVVTKLEFLGDEDGK